MTRDIGFAWNAFNATFQVPLKGPSMRNVRHLKLKLWLSADLCDSLSNPSALWAAAHPPLSEPVDGTGLPAGSVTCHSNFKSRSSAGDLEVFPVRAPRWWPPAGRRPPAGKRAAFEPDAGRPPWLSWSQSPSPSQSRWLSEYQGRRRANLPTTARRPPASASERARRAAAGRHRPGQVLRTKRLRYITI